MTDTKLDQTMQLAEGAYSEHAYANWPAVAKMLLKRGYTPHQSAAIMLSKWTRWAGDMSEVNQYGRYTSADVARFLDSGKGISLRQVEELTAKTFGNQDWFENNVKVIGLSDSDNAKVKAAIRGAID
jgi:hypothetical protein